MTGRRVHARWAARTAVLALVVSGVGVVSTAQAVQGTTPSGAVAAATVKLDVGGQGACSGALLSPWWVITAESCFTETQGAPVATGTPTLATTATIGRGDLTGTAGQVVRIDQLVPHPDRDVVLARLSTPVQGVTPVTVSSTAPVVGEQLTVTGYGRTSIALVPDTAHVATYSVGAVSAATIDINATTTGATICKGDAGGPALRTTSTGIELVAIHHTAFQGGCLGSPNTLQGATETRLDNVRDWITGTTANLPVRDLVADDWSGDTHADVLAVDVAGYLWYYPHNGGGLSSRVALGGGWSSFRHVIATDFSGDGHADVLGVDDAGRLWYYPHNGGGLSPGVQIGSGWAPFTHVTADDWNNDGRADVLGVDADGVLWLYLNVGLALPDRVQLGAGWGSFRHVMAADYSGDGHADVVGVDAGGQLWYYPHNGPGLSAPVHIGSGWATFKDVMVSDWTADGRADVLGVDSADTLWIYTNSNGSLPARVAVPGAPQMS